jgi:hypothetical protein
MKHPARANIIPINVAEAIIDPLWDPARSGLRKWKIAEGSKHCLRVQQYWCYSMFEWAHKPEKGPALSMTRSFDLDILGYVRLIACIMAPEKSVIELTAITDRGAYHSRHAARPYKGEYVLDLKRSRKLISVTMSLFAGAGENQMGWLYWVGLQKEQALLDRHLEQWRDFDPDWPEHLQPADHRPSFKPKVGLIANEKEWRRMAERHERFLKRGGASSFLDKARQAGKTPPEAFIGENIKCMAERLFCRERENEQPMLGTDIIFADSLATAAMLKRDPALLRLAARHALSIASCEHWDDFCCYVPGGSWDQRCFTATIAAFECAFVLDLAWDIFTPLGREFLKERIAKLGLGDITFNTWKYEYIFDCNQLAFFTWGRIPAALLLESVWPRVRNETEQAYRDLVESLERIILPDGGFVEGPSYFTMVGRHAGMALYMYARGRKQPLKKVVPPVFRLTSDFAALIASTDESKDVIPFCDSRDTLDHDTFSFMAACLPKSPWTAIYRKAVKRNNGLPATPMALKLDQDIPALSPPPKPFVFLPVMGAMASTRKLGKETVKLFIMGNKAGAGHTHEDKGSFVLEFAGDTFACDPGTADYSLPNAARLKYCQFHNMLVPTGTDERPLPASPLPVDVKPKGKGDRIRFHAGIDVSPGWEPYYRTWKRTWTSIHPGELVIVDDYELKRGTGVEFLWQTRLPVTVDGQTIVIKGRRGSARIGIPSDVSVKVEHLSLATGGPLVGTGRHIRHHRIRLAKNGKHGRIELRVRLYAGKNG